MLLNWKVGGVSTAARVEGVLWKGWGGLRIERVLGKGGEGGHTGKVWWEEGLAYASVFVSVSVSVVVCSCGLVVAVVEKGIQSVGGYAVVVCVNFSSCVFLRGLTLVVRWFRLSSFAPRCASCRLQRVIGLSLPHRGRR